MSDLSQPSSESVTEGSPILPPNPRLRRDEKTDIAEALGFHLGNAFMCIATMGHTGDAIADLHRAVFHIESEITRLQKKGKQRGS